MRDEVKHFEFTCIGTRYLFSSINIEFFFFFNLNNKEMKKK